MVLKELRNLRTKRAWTENFVFYLHYRWTVLTLVSFSFVITCRLALGDSISCFERDSEIPRGTLNTLCYQGEVYLEQNQLYNGIKTGDASRVNQDVKKYYTYYNWVNLILLVQAVMFYLPHLLWKIFEKGYIFRLTNAIDNIFLDENRRNMELCQLAKYVRITQGKHKHFTAFHVFMEFVNCAISVLMTVWLVRFFKIVEIPEIPLLNLESWSEFSMFYFPARSKCMYEIYGRNSGLNQYHALCMLPLNQLYMCIFLYLYAWYIFLAIIGGAVIIYRLCSMIVHVRFFALSISAPLTNKAVLKSVCSRLSYHDWFFMMNLKENLSDVDFAQLVDKLAAASSESRNCQENPYNGKDTDTHDTSEL